MLPTSLVPSLSAKLANAASKIQRRVPKRSAGLHTGECEIIEDNVGGIAVHTAARVASLAHAGEVLVSHTVKDLVAGSGIRFESRGAVVCGFGVMFVSDKKAAFAEARRVLKEGGILLFNLWDRIEENPHNAVCAEVVEGLFPGDDEMRFRIPYEMHDPALLRQLLAQAHFADVRIEKKRLQLGYVSARTIATGQIRGTPRSLLIERRGISLDEVVEKVTAALAKIGGMDPYRGPIQALIAEAR